MSETSEINEDSMKLGELYEKGFEIYTNLQRSDESPISERFQDDVKKGLKIFEDLTRLVSALGMFSANEEIKEMPTEHIRYLSLPALLGDLSSKLTSEDRLDILNVSEVYYKDFLRRLNDYGVVSVTVGEETSDSDVQQAVSRTRDVTELVRQRDEKIRRFKEMKECEERLRELEVTARGQTADDDLTRKYFLSFLKSLSYKAQDELESMKMERPMLAHMAKLKEEGVKGDGSGDGRRGAPRAKPLKPIIITRDQVQKKVFGMGYPSLPTMTVDEFMDQKIKERSPQLFNDYSLQNMAAAGVDPAAEYEKQDVDKEEALARDDPEAVSRARDWDDWKDDHRRGYGNTKNMG